MRQVDSNKYEQLLDGLSSAWINPRKGRLEIWHTTSMATSSGYPAWLSYSTQFYGSGPQCPLVDENGTCFS